MFVKKDSCVINIRYIHDCTILFSNMWGAVEYLNDPYLVAKVQKYFGVEPAIKQCHNRESRYVSGEENINTVNKGILHRKTHNNVLINDKVNCTKEFVKIAEKINGVSVTEKCNEETVSSESDTEGKGYVINNRFWYYLFVFGTLLGDEIFYASFIPFWFWNIDGAVGRRVVMVWTVIMYIGQGIKDIVCWPRPACPPVFRLQSKWALEYGMPSTHAMVGVSIPFSVILYTMNRYKYPVWAGIFIALCWSTVISVSRIYLGMHSVLDIVVGLLLALILMFPVVPLVDALDFYLLTNRWSPILLVTVSILIIVFYPNRGGWTPTRGDTATILGVSVGVTIGAWTNYQLGAMTEPSQPPPYDIIWPTYEMIGTSILRTIIGFCCIIGTRAICKSASYATLCFLLQSSEIKNSAHSKTKTAIELSYKYITYVLLGFNILYLLPSVFRLLRIERPTFYTEM